MRRKIPTAKGYVKIRHTLSPWPACFFTLATVLCNFTFIRHNLDTRGFSSWPSDRPAVVDSTDWLTDAIGLIIAVVLGTFIRSMQLQHGIENVSQTLYRVTNSITPASAIQLMEWFKSYYFLLFNFLRTDCGEAFGVGNWKKISFCWLYKCLHNTHYTGHKQQVQRVVICPNPEQSVPVCY